MDKQKLELFNKKRMENELIGQSCGSAYGQIDKTPLKVPTKV